MPELNLIGDRYKYPVSTDELNRRLAAVQKKMQEMNLDCCLAQTQSTIFDSVVRYFTDTVTHAYGTTLIIPAEGKITLITHGLDLGAVPVPPTMRNVEKFILKPHCQPFGCTDGILANTITDEIEAKGYKKIGLIMKQLVSADTLDILRERIKGCEIVDFTTEFSYIKAVKSEEELLLCNKCVRAHEDLMSMVPALIRPGVKEYTVIAELERASRRLCCDWIGNIAVGTGKKGRGTGFYQNPNANGTIEKGDLINVMVEVSGPGGIYGELARPFILGGEPDPEYVKLYETAKATQDVTAKAAVPGATGKEVSDAFDKYVTQFGLAPNLRFGGHSQGFDMMEGPAISPYETMELKENMFFAIHPELSKDGMFTIACDNYLITRDGARRLTRTPREITLIEY